MFRPLSDDEKKTALRDGAVGMLREMRRRETDLREIRETAQKVFLAFVTAPTHHVVEAPIPEWMTPPRSEGWRVTAKVIDE